MEQLLPSATNVWRRDDLSDGENLWILTHERIFPRFPYSLSGPEIQTFPQGKIADRMEDLVRDDNRGDSVTFAVYLKRHYRTYSGQVIEREHHYVHKFGTSQQGAPQTQSGKAASSGPRPKPPAPRREQCLMYDGLAQELQGHSARQALSIQHARPESTTWYHVWQLK